MTMDLLVHTWDLARAMGADERLDEEIVREAFEALKPMDAMIRQPNVCGPRLEAAPGCGSADRVPLLPGPPGVRGRAVPGTLIPLVVIGAVFVPDRRRREMPREFEITKAVLLKTTLSSGRLGHVPVRPGPIPLRLAVEHEGRSASGELPLLPETSFDLASPAIRAAVTIGHCVSPGRAAG